MSTDNTSSDSSIDLPSAPPVNFNVARSLAKEALAVTSAHPLGVTKTRQLGELVHALLNELSVLEKGKQIKGQSLRRPVAGQSERSRLVTDACEHQSLVLGRPYTIGDLARAIGLEGQQAMLSPSRIDRLNADRVAMIRALCDPSSHDQ